MPRDSDSKEEATGVVERCMKPSPGLRWPLAAIEVGAGLFIVVLALSALVEPAVWLLHTVQALIIYGGVILLARRDSPWGFGAGFTIAALWNTANLFVTGFAAGGLQALLELVRGGRLTHPALLLVLVGTVGHFLMIVGCAVGFLRRRPRPGDWWRLVGGAILLILALVAIFPLRTHSTPLPLDVPPAHDHLR